MIFDDETITDVCVELAHMYDELLGASRMLVKVAPAVAIEENSATEFKRLLDFLTRALARLGVIEKTLQVAIEAQPEKRVAHGRA